MLSRVDLNLKSETDGLSKVDFYKDNELIGSVNDEPFSIQNI